MSRTKVNSRRAMAACAVAGLALINANLIMAQEKPVSSTPPLPPQPISNNPFHIDESTGGGLAKHPANQTKDGPWIDNLPAGSFETLETGYRRVRGSMTRTLSPEELAEIAAAGKGADLKGNQQTLDTIVDHLPANWMLAPNNLPAGVRVDSYGNPIVNTAQALPDWAQRDVDDLRGEIASMRLHLQNLDLALAGNAGQIVHLPLRRTAEAYAAQPDGLVQDRFESEHVLGNFVGQAIVRNIDVSDLIDFGDVTLEDNVVDGIADYLHYYENLKAHYAALWNEPFLPGNYAADVVGMLQAHGHSMQQVLTLVPQNEGGIAGAGGCYSESTSAPGITFLASPTIIWAGSATTSFDDQQADVPIGFRYYYNPCETTGTDDNFNVRVSTNGYVTFFEQGGGAVDGTDFTNDPLPSTNDPDGMIAGWWDDLIIGGTDGDWVQYDTEGSVGARTFTVEYFSVSRLGATGTNFYYFQIKLFENSGTIQIDYHTLWNGDALDSATSGIEDFAGDDADCGINCTNTINVDPPANTHTFTYPAPTNNTCANAICIEEDGPLFGSNFGATGSDQSGCTFNDFADVWYSYTAAVSASTTVTLCTGGNQYDASLAVYTGSCAGLTEVACNDDFCGAFLPSQVTFPATDGTTYLIRVAGYDGGRGTFNVAVDSGTTGDSCQNPHPLSTPGTGTFFTDNNTGCNDESSCAGSADTIDEWFLFTPVSSGVYRFTTCNATTDFDTTLSIFQGFCGTLLFVERACNDDGSAFEACDLGGPNWKSRILLVADAGQDYYVRVAGFGGAVGDYALNVAVHNCPADIAPISAGDGVVDINDLLAIISAWGACSVCREDFVPAGGNNVVDINDLLAVISAWGSCP